MVRLNVYFLDYKVNQKIGENLRPHCIKQLNRSGSGSSRRFLDPRIRIKLGERGFSSTGNIRQVQSVQNAAARLLTGARRREHISPVLRQLHWLPIQSRVNFKLPCFVFSSLSGHAPSYLSDDIHLVSERPRRHLRSSTDRSCVVPRTYNTFGDRSFAVGASCLE